MPQEVLHIAVDFPGVAIEFRHDGGSDLRQRRWLRQPLPDEGGYLVHGVDGFQVAEPLPKRNQHGFAGDCPRDEVLGPPIAGVFRQAFHGA